MDEDGRRRSAVPVSDQDLPAKRACRIAPVIDAKQLRCAFIANFKTMVDDLQPEELLPMCQSRKVLSPQESDEIVAEKTREAKNNRLLSIIHRKSNANPAVLNDFMEVLEELNPPVSRCYGHIIEGLRSHHPPSSSEFPVNYMEELHILQAKLQMLYQVICTSVDVTHILPELVSREVITMSQNEEVRTEVTREQKASSLLRMVHHSDASRLACFFEVLRNSNELPDKLQVADLLGHRCQLTQRSSQPEAKAFKKAMGKLMVSLKGEDVDRITLCLYSHNIISESLRNMILVPRHSEHERMINLLCHMETKIKQSPNVFMQIVEIFTEELQLGRVATLLETQYRKVGGSLDSPSSWLFHSVEKDSKSSCISIESLPDPIAHFSQQLKEMYNTPRALKNQKWPSTSTNSFYINLAAIKKEKFTPATADEFTKETIRGDLDVILQTKEPVTMEDIFLFEAGSRLQVILVQGAPGVGKSTFALEIAKKWSVFESMEVFELVLLFQLRQPYSHHASNLKDLLQVYWHDPSTIDDATDYFNRKEGDGLLFILDGLDELPAELLGSSVYMQLLQGSYLPKATILLTTRPSVTSCVEQVCDSRLSKNIEVLGFLSNDIDTYARKFFNDEEAEHFLQYVYSHPHIKSMMYIPLNTAIVVEIYRCFTNSQSGRKLPMTLTQLYTELCLCLLVRYIKGKGMEFKQECLREGTLVARLAFLPQKVQQQLKEIATVAFRGICEQKVVFYKLCADFEHMDFMNKCERLVCFGSDTECSFNFLHLTVQEFLAAFHISLLPEDMQIELLKVHQSKPYFFQVWRFLAGLTCFKANGWQTFADTVRVPSCGSDMKMCNSLLANCLYEAQDPSTCSHIFSHGHVVYSPMSATQYDYYTLGYCISNSTCNWKLCSIGGEGLATIAAGIKNTPDHPKGRIELIKLSYNGEKIHNLMELPVLMMEDLTELNLSNCGLSKNACTCLSKLIPHFPNLERMDLGDNPFAMGDAQYLLRSLSQLSKLNYLDLLHAQLGLDDIHALSALIKPGGSLNNLIIGSTTMTVTVVEEMVNVILQNSNLHNLSIMNLDLAQFGSHLGKRLQENKTLWTLMLWDRSFCIEGCVEVVRALKKNDTLHSLTLMPWYRFHIPDSLFKSVRQGRIKWFYYPEQNQ